MFVFVSCLLELVIMWACYVGAVVSVIVMGWSVGGVLLLIKVAADLIDCDDMLVAYSEPRYWDQEENVAYPVPYSFHPSWFQCETILELHRFAYRSIGK